MTLILRIAESLILVSSTLIAGNPSLSFTENLGQVKDQHNKPRPDILFSGVVNGLTYHLRDNGISYQVSQINSWEEQKVGSCGGFLHEEQKIRIPGNQTIYRLDLTWLNCGKKLKIEATEQIEGFSNYYLETCPQGVHNVKSYRIITYKDVYENVDVKYYEDNGRLKYDYVIGPNSNYKQIEIKVSGAQFIEVLEDGSLSITTQFGKIEENAPEVYQNNKKLKASWVVKDNILSFDIKDYIDPRYTLIIDPAVRAWGTFYGGAGDEGNLIIFAPKIAHDTNGNIFMPGTTSSSTGTNIATTGAFQSSYGGGLTDAYIVKLDPLGQRLWSTYYGFSGNDSGNSCSTDFFGGVYLCGATTSSLLMASAGSHQPTFGGGNGNPTDAFLVKFNGATGVRQWGTYYGGNASDYGAACATDALGFVYLTGQAGSITGTVIATPGSHQPASSMQSSDGFLVKFSSAGIRQWGTYYGGSGTDEVYSTSTDLAGNVYISGMTGSSTGSLSNGTTIATPAAHQPTLSGNSAEAFLVKFNSAGVRLWGTYYGATGQDYGWDCQADQNQNVYLSCSTTSTSSLLATPGSHQPNFGGGLYDAILTKFNQNGQRIWATFYGGSGYDTGITCAVDIAGDVYLGGSTQHSVGTVIATPGSHQPTFGGGNNDGYFVKFSSNGQRLWGSYYGGTGGESIFDIDIDQNNTLYIHGSTNSTGTAIATPGSHQSSFAGGTDAFLVKFTLCEPLNVTPFSQQNICSGSSTTLSVLSTFSITWYSSPSSTISIGSSSTFVTPTLNVGNYYFYAEASGCSERTPVQVISLPVPTITVSNGTICIGDTFTFQPSGASTYTISGGSLVVSPSVTTTYSIIGTSSAGCLSANTITTDIFVNPLPIVAINSGTICIGTSFTFNPMGAQTYTIQGGNSIVSPTVSTVYTVLGTSSVGCIGASVNCSITVVPLPTITVNSGSVCLGNSFTITPSGASTYTIEGGNSIVSPLVTSSYSLVGADVNGCINTATSIVTVAYGPTISVNDGTICVGKSFTIMPSGANSYTIQGGSSVVAPVSNSSYTVVGASMVGCLSVNTATSNITVNSTPSVNITSSSTNTICAGQSVTLTAVGATTYSWSTSSTNSLIVVNPIVSTTYTLLGTNSEGCMANTAFTQYVSSCTSLIDLNSLLDQTLIYPNPSTGLFYIELNHEASIELFNLLGQCIFVTSFKTGTSQLNLCEMAGGVFFLKITREKHSKILKIIKE